MHTHLHMPSRNVAIREEVYRKLKESKGPNKSFSDAIEELLEGKGSLLPLWGSLSKSKSLRVIERDLEELRRGVKIRK